MSIQLLYIAIMSMLRVNKSIFNSIQTQTLNTYISHKTAHCNQCSNNHMNTLTGCNGPHSGRLSESGKYRLKKKRKKKTMKKEKVTLDKTKWHIPCHHFFCVFIFALMYFCNVCASMVLIREEYMTKGTHKNTVLQLLFDS